MRFCLTHTGNMLGRDAVIQGRLTPYCDVPDLLFLPMRLEHHHLHHRAVTKAETRSHTAAQRRHPQWLVPGGACFACALALSSHPLTHAAPCLAVVRALR